MTFSDQHSKAQILIAVCLAALVLPLGFSGGAIATPAIGRDLEGSPVELNWITNAFMLSFGSFLMAAGTLADRYGRKKIFTAGIGLFAAISLLLGCASSILFLDLLRAVQGIAAAAALAGGSAALAQEFNGHARTKAFSLLGTTFGVGLAFGPILAGILIEYLGWRSVFLSATIIGVMALLFGASRMHETRDPDAVNMDWRGTLSFSATLSLFTLAVIRVPESGWTNSATMLILAGSITSLVAFIMIEIRMKRPMLDLSLFRYPRFIGVQVLPIATCYCYVVLLVLLPLRFIGIEGYDEAETGELMIALSAPLLAIPFLAAILTRWLPANIISGVGLLIAAEGLWWLGRISPGIHDKTIVLPMLLVGLGTGMPWGLMDGLSVSVVPKERAGMATGIFSTTRVAGEGIALTIVSAVLSCFLQQNLSSQFPHTVPDVHQRIANAAQQLVTGDFLHAQTLLPETTRSAFFHAYEHAFGNVIDILVTVTIISSFVVLVFLRQQSKEASDISH